MSIDAVQPAKGQRRSTANYLRASGWVAGTQWGYEVALPTSFDYAWSEPGRVRTYAEWQAALALPSVRGLVVGRTMLYPADDDVAKAVDTAVSLVR